MRGPLPAITYFAKDGSLNRYSWSASHTIVIPTATLGTEIKNRGEKSSEKKRKPAAQWSRVSTQIRTTVRWDSNPSSGRCCFFLHSALARKFRSVHFIGGGKKKIYEKFLFFILLFNIWCSSSRLKLTSFAAYGMPWLAVWWSRTPRSAPDLNCIQSTQFISSVSRCVCLTHEGTHWVSSTEQPVHYVHYRTTLCLKSWFLWCRALWILGHMYGGGGGTWMSAN